MPPWIRFLFLLAVTLPGGAARAAPGASFTGVGDLPGGITASRAYGVSGDGSTVVGQSHSDVGWEGFVWRSGVLTNLGEGGRNQSFIAASEHGELLVGQSGVTWENGVFGSLRDPAAGLYWIWALGMTPDGSIIVGQGANPETLDGEAFLWEDGATARLGDLAGGGFSSQAFAVSDDGTVVVGMGRSDEQFREAFRRTAADGMMGLGDLPGGDASSAAIDVSADGSVIVGWGSTSVGTAAVYWEEDVIHPLGSLPGLPRSAAQAISADGSIIVGGSWRVAGTDNQVYLWTEEDGMRSLYEILSVDYELDLTGWQLKAAHDISDDGRTIVGQGTNPQGDLEGWVAVLPADTLAVSIDIRPQSPHNPIQPFSRGMVLVAILGSHDFDVREVERDSLLFGPAGAAPLGRRGGLLLDLNGDGEEDLLALFPVRDTGIALGDVEACLSGETRDGTPFEGCDAVHTRGRHRRGVDPR